MRNKPTRFTYSEFKQWLTRCGAIIVPPITRYEVLRVSCSEGMLVIYQDKGGVDSWPPGLRLLRRRYMAGQAMRLSPDIKARNRAAFKVEEIADRDGLKCWYCSLKFSSPNSDAITIEHMLARAHGGSDHISNLVLACAPCNVRAGVLSIAEKVKLRDTILAEIIETERKRMLQ